MNKNRISVIILLSVVFLVLLSLFIAVLAERYLPHKSTSPNEVKIVIDGDTFELNSGERVRLICIDAPEKGKEGYNESKDYLERLVLGREVRLEKDVSEYDENGRLLRYVYLGDLFVNLEMVRGGYASYFKYGNDTRLCPLIEEGEKSAKNNSLGIWAL